MLSYMTPSSTSEDKPNPFKPEGPESSEPLEPPEVQDVDESEKRKASESEAESEVMKIAAKISRIDEVISEVKSEDLSPVSENRSIVSDSLTTPGSEDRSISKFAKPALKR